MCAYIDLRVCIGMFVYMSMYIHVHGVYRCMHMCVHVYVCVYVCMFSEERVHSFFQIFNKILTLQNSNNSYFSPSLCVDKKQAPYVSVGNLGLVGV